MIYSVYCAIGIISSWNGFVGCILLMMVYGTKINNSNLINITFLENGITIKAKSKKQNYFCFNSYIIHIHMHKCINIKTYIKTNTHKKLTKYRNNKKKNSNNNNNKLSNIH